MGYNCNALKIELDREKSWFRTFLIEVLITLALAVVIFLIIHSTIQSSVVLYSSMEPNLHEGQRIIISKIIYNFHEPERGDIIIFPDPDNPSEGLVKRIIGLPGETVEIKNGVVYIHQAGGEIMTLDESDYITNPADNYYLSDVIPEDNYFVMGDNRNNSYDSRRGWTVEREDIIGKAWLSIWPLSEFGLAPNHSFAEET